MKVDFDRIFRLNAAQKLVAEHCVSDFYMIFQGGLTLGCRALYERNFDMIFHFTAAQKLVAEHYERDFDWIFRLKADQNLVVEHSEWDFYMIFHFKEAQHLVAEHSERFWHDFSLYGGSTLDCRPLWKRMGDWLYSYDNEQK